MFDRAFVNFDLGSATTLALVMFAGNILFVLTYLRRAKCKTCRNEFVAGSVMIDTLDLRPIRPWS